MSVSQPRTLHFLPEFVDKAYKMDSPENRTHSKPNPRYPPKYAPVW